MDTVDRTMDHSALTLGENLEERDKLTRSTSTTCSSDSFGNPSIIRVPTGLKIVALVSMTTAIILIAVSGILLSKTHDTLVKWMKAAPTTMPLLAQLNDLLGGTTGIVEEVESQEMYLRILITCSAILVITGMVQLLCNIWFFCRMNAPCIRNCLSNSEQFFCGI